MTGSSQYVSILFFQSVRHPELPGHSPGHKRPVFPVISFLIVADHSITIEPMNQAFSMANPSNLRSRSPSPGVSPRQLRLRGRLHHRLRPNRGGLRPQLSSRILTNPIVVIPAPEGMTGPNPVVGRPAALAPLEPFIKIYGTFSLSFPEVRRICTSFIIIELDHKQEESGILHP